MNKMSINIANEEQVSATGIVIDGHNLVVTGQVGTGKGFFAKRDCTRPTIH